MFNISINDMLFFVSKSGTCNFADDNPLSSCGRTLGNILHNLKFELGYILKWFKVNSFQFVILGANTYIKVNLFLNGNKVGKYQEVVFLEIIIDDKLALKRILKIFVEKSNVNYTQLQRIRKYLSTDKAKTLCNAFISSEFYYAPLIWMFSGKLLILKERKYVAPSFDTFNSPWNKFTIILR